MVEHPEAMPPDPDLPAGSVATLLECPFCEALITGIADSCHATASVPPTPGNLLLAECCGQVAILDWGATRQGMALRVPYPAEVGRIAHSPVLTAEVMRRVMLAELQRAGWGDGPPGHCG